MYWFNIGLLFRNGYLARSWCCSFCLSICPWLLCFLNFSLKTDWWWLPMDALMSKSWKLEKNHCMNGFIFHYIKRKNSNKLGTTGLHMTKRALFGWTNQVVCLHLTWRRQLFVYVYLIEAHNIVLFFSFYLKSIHFC